MSQKTFFRTYVGVLFVMLLFITFLYQCMSYLNINKYNLFFMFLGQVFGSVLYALLIITVIAVILSFIRAYKK